MEVFSRNAADPATVTPQARIDKGPFFQSLRFDERIEEARAEQISSDAKVAMTTRPTAVQDKAFRLLGASPACTR